MSKDMDALREATKKFYAGESSVNKYKGLSGGYGTYAQKGAQASMVRLRFAGGRISKEDLLFIADMIDKYKVSMVHFTTCQAVQLHNVAGNRVCDLVQDALDHGIITLGGGGDYPRNVTASPLSGVEKGECFDVLPYAKAAEAYLLPLVDTLKMPRKLKVGFSNSPENETHATFRDLGFMAKENGKFDVYSAGGLGNNPRMGLCVAKDAEPKDILYYIRAMIRTFCKNGNYENRAKARTRYMQETLGEEGYLSAFAAELKGSFDEGGLDIKADIRSVAKEGKGNIAGPCIYEQKQKGLYYVSYHAVGGDPFPAKIRQIYDAIKDMNDVEVRISPDETMYIINCNSEEAAKVAEVTDDGARTLFESSISCVGATICQQGLRDSHGLLVQLVEMSRKAELPDGSLPRVHISGCTSSCGSHQIGVIGFQGSSARNADGPVTAFTVFINGSHIAGKERFGDAVGKMSQDDIPKFLEELGRSVAATGKDYRAWAMENTELLMTIVDKYLIKE